MRWLVWTFLPRKCGKKSSQVHCLHDNFFKIYHKQKTQVVFDAQTRLNLPSSQMQLVQKKNVGNFLRWGACYNTRNLNSLCSRARARVRTDTR